MPKSTLSRSEQKRAQVLEAAIELFCDKGYPHTSMEEVAKLANVSKQTVYSHFGSKDELFVASIESRCVFHGESESVLIDPLNPEEELIAYAQMFSSIVLSQEALTVFRACIANLDSHPQLSDMYFQAGPMHTIEILSDYLQKMEKTGCYQFDNTRDCAVRLCMMLLGEMRLKLELGLATHALEPSRHGYMLGCIQMFLKAYRV